MATITSDSCPDDEEVRLLDLNLPTGALACTAKLRQSASSDTAPGTAITTTGYADVTFTVSAAAIAGDGLAEKFNTTDLLFTAGAADWPPHAYLDVYVGARWARRLDIPDGQVTAGNQLLIPAGEMRFTQG